MLLEPEKMATENAEVTLISRCARGWFGWPWPGDIKALEYCYINNNRLGNAWGWRVLMSVWGPGSPLLSSANFSATQAQSTSPKEHVLEALLCNL